MEYVHRIEQVLAAPSLPEDLNQAAGVCRRRLARLLTLRFGRRPEIERLAAGRDAVTGTSTHRDMWNVALENPFVLGALINFALGGTARQRPGRQGGP